MKWDQVGKVVHGISTALGKGFYFLFLKEIIRIYHECEGRIEKSVPRIAVWHHEACRVMTNGDPEGQIFLSYPRMNDGFFSCSPLFLSINLFILNKLPEVPEYANMQFHMMTLLDVLGKIAWVR